MGALTVCWYRGAYAVRSFWYWGAYWNRGTHLKNTDTIKGWGLLERGAYMKRELINKNALKGGWGFLSKNGHVLIGREAIHQH